MRNISSDHQTHFSCVFKQGHIPALDGFRGLAVIAVMLAHFLASSNLLNTNTLLERSLKYMHYGVDFFFVLSGFLITGILLDTKTKPHYFRTFFIRRSLRIFPLYYLALFIAFTISNWAYGPHQGDSHWWHWLYISNIGVWIKSNWLSNPAGFDLGHFWSLAVEEQFYLLWPAVVWFTNRDALAKLCLATLVAAPFIHMAFMALTNNPTVIYTLTPCRIHELCLGAGVAVMIREAKGREQLGRWAFPILCISSGLIILELCYPMLGIHNLLRWIPMTITHPVTFPLFAAACLVMAIQEDRAKAWKAFLKCRVLRFFGKYSYAIYVYHHLFRPFWEKHFYTFWAGKTGDGTWTTGIAYIVTASIATILIALISWKFFEAPVLELKKYFSYNPSENYSHPKTSQGIRLINS